MSLQRSRKKYKTSRDIVIPRGTTVVYVRQMKHEVMETAVALVTLDPLHSYEWMMSFDDALTSGLIEETE